MLSWVFPTMNVVRESDRRHRRVWSHMREGWTTSGCTGPVVKKEG